MNRDSIIPIYAVTGALSAGKTTFIKQCISRRKDQKNVLYIQFEMGMEPLHENALYIHIRDAQTQTDEELAARIAEAVIKSGPEEIWLEWNGMLPVRRLISILQAKALQGLIKLHRLIQVADGEDYLQLLSQSGSITLEQVTQCDLVAVRNAHKKLLGIIRRSLKQIQNNQYVLDFEDAGQIDSLLYYPNVKETVRILTIFSVGVATFYLLSLLSLPIPASVTVFLGTWLQAIPFLMLGILLSSIIQVFVTTDFLKRLFPKSLLGGMLFGLIGGFFLPVCDCASIPVFRSLVRKGVPLPAAVVFMTAAPVINPVVMLSTYYAFGGNAKVMLARVILGMISSVIISLFFIRQKGTVFTSRLAETSCACCQTYSEKKGPAPKLMKLAAHFRNELFEVAKYLLIGIGVSTFFQIALGGNLANAGSMGIAKSMLLMMLMAFLLSLCSSSDAVVGKNMGSSFPMSSVMGFLVFGPMLDIKNLILMSSSLNKRFIVKMAAVIFAVCFAVVYIASLLGLEGWIQ